MKPVTLKLWTKWTISGPLLYNCQSLAKGMMSRRGKQSSAWVWSCANSGTEWQAVHHPCFLHTLRPHCRSTALRNKTNQAVPQLQNQSWPASPLVALSVSSGQQEYPGSVHNTTKIPSVDFVTVTWCCNGLVAPFCYICWWENKFPV